MAIDLIENSELAALAPSRIGATGFVSDSEYLNFSMFGVKIGGKKKAASSVNLDSADFAKQLDALYGRFNVKSTVNQARSYLKSNPALVRQVAKTYGVPNTAEELRFNNTAFDMMSKFMPVPGMNCADLEALVSRIDNEIEANTKAIGSGASARVSNRPNRVLEDMKKMAKNEMDGLRCSQIKEQAEQQAAQQDTLAALKQITSDSKTSNLTKYVIFGAGVVIVGVAAYILFKPKKSS